MDLRLYVREGCHLCEQFWVELSLDLGPDIGWVAVLDVDRDPALGQEYGLRVPVLAQEGQVICEGLYDRPRVRQALQL